MKRIGTGSRKYCEGTDITRGFVPSLKFRLLAIVYQDLEDTAYVYDSSGHNKKKQHVQDFKVQLNLILKEEWSIDEELLPRIDKHEDAQRGDDRQNDQTSTSK